jgi:O-antigen ligase
MVDAVNASRARALRNPALGRVADGLALVAVVALPWSTSITSIAIGLWLIALLPTLDTAALRRELMTPAGGLPVVLWFLAALGMLWAEAKWGQRFDALNGYVKLLIIPLLLVQFRCSDRGWQVVAGYLASITALLLASWIIMAFPALGPRNPIPGLQSIRGLPVRDSIAQSGEFVACAFGLLYLAGELWAARRRGLAGLSIAVALAMLANIVYVVASRTSLVVILVLLVMLGAVRLRWKGRLVAAFMAILVITAVWQSSPYLRWRVDYIATELADHARGGVRTSGAQRLAFWNRSVTLVEEAPLIGYGTEPIDTIFSRARTNETGLDAVITSNPHNQVLAVGLQLGVIGVAILLAMWAAHLLLFFGGGLVGWLGLVIVVQNIVSSLFNSHLLDFTQGWTYAFAVGVLGGLVRRGSRFPAALKPLPPP